MAEPLIRLHEVAKDYVGGGGVVHALREVELDIAHGEFVAVVGTSGSGKSTLMNILGCLDRPTHGTYQLGDIEVGQRGNDPRAIVRNRLIGFIFQGFNLLPRTTALENCELPLQYRGVPARERRARAKEALTAVGLGDRMDHTPGQLSGGQQQRVAIARAIVTDPPLLLADEPTGNLDTRTSLEVLALLQKLNRDRGITVVIVTHEHDIAACADRVISFRDGRIVSDVRQERHIDAAKALTELPPVDTSVTHDPKADAELAALHAAKAKLPIAIYLFMVLGMLLGNFAGYLYSAIIIGHRVGWIMALGGVIAEAWLGARAGRVRLAHPLASDQRMKVALLYTSIFGVLQGIVLWFTVFKIPGPMFAQFAGARGGVLFAVTAASILFASALLRYLLLSLFSSGRPKARKKARA